MTPKRRIIPVFVPHLGCPNDCVFCNQRRISGALSPALPEDVTRAVAEGLLAIPDGAEAEIAFYGGSFTAIPCAEREALLSAAGPFLRSGRVTSIRISTRPDCIDAEVLAQLKQYGVGTVELGVQSMCEDVLRLSGRGHTSEDAEAAARMVKKAGFKLILQMMTGLPGDTAEKSIYTARRLAELEPDGVRIYPTVVIRDTALCDMWLSGKYKEHTVGEAARLCASLLDIFDSHGIAVIRLGLNPTDELSGGAAVAGAYHPAFGELVASERYLAAARSALRGALPGEKLTLLVAQGQTSAMTGQKRKNIILLEQEFGLKQLKVRETDMKKGAVETLRN